MAKPGKSENEIHKRPQRRVKSPEAKATAPVKAIDLSKGVESRLKGSPKKKVASSVGKKLKIKKDPSTGEVQTERSQVEHLFNKKASKMTPAERTQLADYLSQRADNIVTNAGGYSGLNMKQSFRVLQLTIRAFMVRTGRDTMYTEKTKDRDPEKDLKLRPDPVKPKNAQDKFALSSGRFAKLLEKKYKIPAAVILLLSATPENSIDNEADAEAVSHSVAALMSESGISTNNPVEFYVEYWKRKLTAENKSDKEILKGIQRELKRGDDGMRNLYNSKLVLPSIYGQWMHNLTANLPKLKTKYGINNITLPKSIIDAAPTSSASSETQEKVHNSIEVSGEHTDISEKERKRIINRINKFRSEQDGEQILNYFQEESKEEGVNFAVACALVNFESVGWNHRVRNKNSGATGYGQFLRGTGNEIIRDLRDEYEPRWGPKPLRFPQSLQNPYFNAKATLRLMSKTRKGYDKNKAPQDRLGNQSIMKQAKVYYVAHHEGRYGSRKLGEVVEEMERNGFRTQAEMVKEFTRNPEKYMRLLAKGQRNRIPYYGIKKLIRPYLKKGRDVAPEIRKVISGLQTDGYRGIDKMARGYRKHIKKYNQILTAAQKRRITAVGISGILDVWFKYAPKNVGNKAVQIARKRNNNTITS